MNARRGKTAGAANGEMGHFVRYAYRAPVTPLDELPDRIILATLIWGEARGEPVEGQIAVACVVRNRLRMHALPTPRWRDLCLAPAQFSCFNADDPNYPKVQKAAAMLMTASPTADLQQALWIADGVMSGQAQDNTHGATHYVTLALYRTGAPTWAQGRPIRATIGSQVFLEAA